MARLNGITLKDHLRESFLFNQRLLVTGLIALLLLLILVFQMFRLQIVNQQHYATLSEDNRVSIVPIPPTRGLIYDRNGVLLAQNLPSFTLNLIPERIKDLDKTLAELKMKISLSDEDIKRFHKNRNKQKRRFEGTPLRFRLNDEEVARIAIDQYRMPGVEIRAELSRHYPLGSIASHAVGYVGRINETEKRKLDSNYTATNHIGKVGVERYYEDMLHGKVGFQRVETNAQGRILNVIERTLPVPGKNLYMNLDIRLQKIAEKNFKGENGALIALDPRSGAVLAMVSMPTYDPNLFVNGVDTKTYNALTNSPEQPLFNRALRGRYPPGSTIKPFMALAGLELDEIRHDEHLNCPGWYMLKKNDDRRYRDWKKKGHGKTDMDKAIIESCDVYFYDLALKLNIDRIHQYLAGFGLGKVTGIDIKGELAGLLPSRQWKRKTYRLPWFPGETLISGIGQGFMLTTPLQLANITAALSLHGERHSPRMLYAIQDADASNYKLVEPRSMPSVPKASEANWQMVIDAMQQVVHGRHGTARGIGYSMKYKAAGKTGTAQVFGIKQDEEYDEEKIDKKLRDHALFISFAPVKDPQIAIAVIVENGGSGGAVAAPIARKVMDGFLLHRKKARP